MIHSPLSSNEIDEAIGRLVSSYCKLGELNNRYIYDYISSNLGRWVPIDEALNSLHNKCFKILIDPHYNNASAAMGLSGDLDSIGSLGFTVDKEAVAKVLRDYNECDLYVLDNENNLLIVSCHENIEKGSIKHVWAIN